MLSRIQTLHDSKPTSLCLRKPKPNFLKLKESDLISHLFYFHSFPPKCPKKQLPIFQKVSKLLRIFIFIAKVRKLSFENSFLRRKLQTSKKLKLLKHYNKGFRGEYQFSPSNTPLIHYHRKQLMKSRSPQDIYSLFFFLCKCWGSSLRVEGEDICGDFTMETLPPATGEDDNAVALLEPLDWGDEEASIDLRAQMFIDRFYEEMRMQRQESF